MAVPEDPEVEEGGSSPAAAPTRRRAAAAMIAGLAFAPAARAGTSTPSSPPPPAAPPPGQTLQAQRDSSQRMTAAVHVNGQGPFHFLVDTGSNQSGIASELAAVLKLPAGKPVLVHGIAEAFLCQTVDIADLRVGSLRTGLTDAPVFNRADLGADGLIGLDVLHDRVVAFDFLDQEIDISGRIFSMSGFSLYGLNSDVVSVPARQRFGQLTIIDSQAGRAKMTCFIDTGADRSVGNTALRLAVQALQRPEDVVNYNVLIRSVTGQSVPGIVALVPSMRIGGINFTRFGLAFADLHTFDVWGLNDQPALLVGMDLLRLFAKVAIDFGQRQVEFQTR